MDVNIELFLFPYILLQPIRFCCWLYLSDKLPKYDYGISSFGIMKLEHQSLSLLSEAGPACKMLTSIKSLLGGTNYCLPNSRRQPTA